MENQFVKRDLLLKTDKQKRDMLEGCLHSEAAIVITEAVAAGISLQHVSIYDGGWNSELSGGEVDWDAVECYFGAYGRASMTDVLVSGLS